MENKLKVRLSRIFQRSFTYCRTKNTSDVVEQPFFFPENQHHRQLIDLFSPKPQPFSSLCKPKLSQTQNTHTYEKRPKISDRNSLLVSSANNHIDNGRKCPPVSPITPLNTNNIFYEKKPKKSRNHKTRSRKTNRKSETNEFFAMITANYYGSSWYSSDEDADVYDDETTLFSSRSLSSDSSESFRKHKARLADKRAKTRRDGRNNRVDANNNGKAAAGVVPVEGNGRVTDSFAVVKKSSDPHNDFRTSMVEMIVEKQIFGALELENLLQCFLSLNSNQHHTVIVEVFTEILEALFSNDSC